MLVKGSNYLEALNKVSIVVFDKTGTLTKGVFKVVDITVDFGFTKEQVLEYAAQAESYSNHPIAKSIQEAFGKTIDQSVLSGYEEISGHGIRVLIGGKRILAGNSKLMDLRKYLMQPASQPEQRFILLLMQICRMYRNSR